MSKVVTIVDYGMGNLLSVANAFNWCGAEVRVSDRREHIADADLLVLPGVGAFAKAMEQLRTSGLDEAIQEYTKKERPFLGICLGMQMMLAESKEFGLHEGLGLIEGTVEPIPHDDAEGNPHKIPHIGWADITSATGGEVWTDTILQNTKQGTPFYFVHSFTAFPRCAENRLADTWYNGRQVSAVIRKGSLYGCQFHPEKSGEKGLELIQTFLAI
jgi:glutamine amidotransferase